MYAFHTISDSRFLSMPCITAHNCSAVGGAHAPLRGKAAQRMRRRSRRIARFGCAETGARARRPPLSQLPQKRTRYFLRQTEKPAAYQLFSRRAEEHPTIKSYLVGSLFGLGIRGILSKFCEFLQKNNFKIG